MKESEIQRTILDYLRANDYLHWRNYVGPILTGNGRRTKNMMKGMPDILGVLTEPEHRLFCIEVKSATGKLSTHQRAWRTDLVKAGAIHIVAYSLDDVVSGLPPLT